MSNHFLQNSPPNDLALKTDIAETLRHARAVDIAVSYIQMSGWFILHRYLARIPAAKIRLLTTDQLNVTHPAALDTALSAGIQVKCYQGDRLYHPKVYIIHGTSSARNAVILGSANISGSALEEGIEAGIKIANPRFYAKTIRWFRALFRDPAAKDIDATFVASYRSRWKQASKARARMYHKSRITRQRLVVATAEVVDTLDDVFSTVSLPVSTLGLDHAGNNIRNLSRLQDVLSRFPHVGDKERSELHLLGLMTQGRLSSLGLRAKRKRKLSSIAGEWCSWIKDAEVVELSMLNPRLVSFRKAADCFWSLRPEVRRFFLAELNNPAERPTLQVIELCCNGSEVVETFTMSDFRSLTSILITGSGLSEFIGNAIRDYQENKGSRSWTSEDRKVVLRAWRES